MWIRDTGLWEQTKADLSGDGEVGQAFIAFTTDWAETAQVVMTRSREFQREDGTWSGETPAAEALRQAFPAAESRTGEGGVSLTILAQALVVLLANWGPGPDVFAGLSPIEQKVVGDMIALKQQELAAEADRAAEG